MSSLTRLLIAPPPPQQLARRHLGSKRAPLGGARRRAAPRRMADDEDQDSPCRGLSCSDVELMVSEFKAFFERPDWLQYRADLSKHPSKDDQEGIKRHIKVCIAIRSKVAPNCSLAKKATEHA
eukprot:1999443-Pyramimonas_sp.AAC.1